MNERELRSGARLFRGGILPDSLLTPDMAGWTTHRGTLDKAAAEEDCVAAEARSFATLIDGNEYRNTYVFAFRIRDGLISSIAEHYNALIVDEKLKPLMAKLAGLSGAAL